MRTIQDHMYLIRDWTEARGYSAARMLEAFAEDAGNIASYDARNGERFGVSVAESRKAEKRYRLAAWVLRQIQKGVEEREKEKESD